ncbi:hypothetical protein GCM10022280_21700 [Sphingomonas swuensis]|uniref:Uncharacterized protein n=1 Tax=Sphingomonas swuensis TaxID=977800 RepID=A0ABP7T4B7_9SPHN
MCRRRSRAEGAKGRLTAIVDQDLGDACEFSGALIVVFRQAETVASHDGASELFPHRLGEVCAGDAEPDAFGRQRGLRRRNAGSPAPAEIEALVHCDRSLGRPQPGQIAGPEKVLDLDAELRVGPKTGLSDAGGCRLDASAGSKHCR